MHPKFATLQVRCLLQNMPHMLRSKGGGGGTSSGGGGGVHDAGTVCVHEKRAAETPQGAKPLTPKAFRNSHNQRLKTKSYGTVRRLPWAVADAAHNAYAMGLARKQTQPLQSSNTCVSLGDVWFVQRGGFWHFSWGF